MNESMDSAQLSFADYQERSLQFRHFDTSDWQDPYSEWIDEEAVEMLTQHGPGMLLLLPPEFGFDHTAAPEELRYNMADELGDSLWFCIDIADRLEVSIGGACANSFESRGHTGVAPPQNFDELQALAIERAEDITVLNKLGLMDLEIDENLKYSSLALNPSYVLTRCGRRLSRSLDKGSRDTAPYSASELEGVSASSDALGDYLLSLGYAAKQRLGIDLDSIAQFNLAKLEHRKTYGKANDLHFADWLARR